jgi:RND superfamily putative drug exporter
VIIRLLLVPAVMHLFGDRNWWIPGWLDRRLPTLDIEGTTTLPRPEPVRPSARALENA